jgi:hypothetical protein
VNGFIIADPDAAPSAFYSPTVARSVGGGTVGWSEDPKQALAFARAKDARTFADTFLPHHAHRINIVPYTEPDTE